ncbi:hypothetical protein [Escherichia coli]|uniref:hypothetical protein n=1 Tax=Escherichia coli TaxID=562 RepID=UPI003F4BF14A
MRGVRQQQDEPGRFSICSRQAAVVHRTHSMSGYKTPLLNDFCGEPLKRRVRDYYSTPAIEIEEFETAYKGSPEEKHEFTSYY